jgi:hypothetical protein
VSEIEESRTREEGSERPEEDGGSLLRRRGPDDAPPSRALEILSAILLSITVILTAWSAFQASKWGGAMSISFSEASSARLQANRAAGEAAQARQSDLTLYSQWFQAKANGNEAAATYVSDRFPDRLKVPFQEWVELGGISDPASAPPSPFALDSYVAPGTEDQQGLDAKADAAFQAALRNNQRGDNYTLLGVLFAVVLFFGAIATRFANRNVQLGLLALAGIGFAIGATLLITFPRLI